MSVPCPMFGFTVRLARRPAAIPPEFDALANSLRRLLETHGLEARGLPPRGGAAGAATFDLVVRREGSQATHADRQLVLDWAAQWSSAASVEVGDLVDLSDAG